MSETPEILIVDDDPALRETLADFLTGEGYCVAEAENVRAARARVAQRRPALVLLDLNMPGGDGLPLAAEIRAQYGTPLIIISGKATMTDRVVGLEVGADDYLAKPFELRELLARVRAVLRRAQAHAPQPAAQPDARTASFCGFTLNATRRTLNNAAGEPVALTGAEFNLLLAFVEHPNRVLSRDQIADFTRRDDWDAFDRSIDTQISRLRKKIEAPGADPVIQTVRGEGYVLAAAVAWSRA